MRGGGSFTNPPRRLVLQAPGGGQVIIDANEGILVEDPDGSYVRIFDENPGDGAVIVLNPADIPAHTISPGRIYTGTLTSAGVLTIFEGPSIDGVGRAQIVLDSFNDTGLNTAEIQADVIRLNATNIKLTGIVEVFGGPISIFSDLLVTGNVGDVWVKPTLVNGWTNRVGAFANFQYRKVAGNQIQIVGEIIPGTLADGTVVTTLPVGFRPNHPQLIECRDVANGVARLLFSTNGEVAIFDGAGSTLVQIIPALIPLDTT